MVGRLSATSEDTRETSFLWQRISILIQCFNAILISQTFSYPDEASTRPLDTSFQSPMLCHISRWFFLHLRAKI